MLHEDSHGNSDLVAHFFRRAFNLLRQDGSFGLIATNTIGQGDTRTTGLRWICTHGGTIYNARKRVKWPGQAAVVVSVVNVCRGEMHEPNLLDGREVPIITAYLFHSGGHNEPCSIRENHEKSFIGNYINGAGFTFDDSSPDATPVSEMHRLIARDEGNAQRIFPYLGGEEILNDPQHRHYRYVINFGEMSEEEAQQWPDLMSIIVEKVKPYRLPQSDRASREMWWLFARRGGALQLASQHFEKILVHPNLSNHLAFAFIPKTVVVGAPHNVLVFDRFWAFAILQSRVHEGWARFFASSMKDDLRYTPSDCFETFPFPAGLLEHAIEFATMLGNQQRKTLEIAGREYYEFRASLMVRQTEGLTKTYNRFHDPHETSPDIHQLRALHALMDRTVLQAYGWDDLADRATCEFLLDYEEDESEEETSSRRKKPWRYRWPDEFRDEVLARLLALNAQRATEERLAGATTTSAPKRAPKKKATKRTTTTTPSPPAAPKKARKKRAKGDREMF